LRPGGGSGRPESGGRTPDQAATTITAALADISANSSDSPKGADLKGTLLRVANLANAAHVESHRGQAATWATDANALL